VTHRAVGELRVFDGTRDTVRVAAEIATRRPAIHDADTRHDRAGHGHDHDHHHDHVMPDPAVLELLEGLERHVLCSVGIDIGSSTSHLAVSRLVIQRRGSDLSAEFVVTGREVLYRSPIWLTPYRAGGVSIDVDEVRVRLEGAYAEAGINPDSVDTGAVVITGEALKKENAEQIARMIAGWSGRFMCVSAGPNHEAILAAHGSGSVAASERDGTTVVNVDIGGGTTKISVVEQGTISHLEALSVGARLLAFDDSGRIVRIEEPIRVLLGKLGMRVALGDVLVAADRCAIASLMADILADVLTGASDPVLYRSLLMASDGKPMPAPDRIDQIVFSGGISEFLGDNPPVGFGDLGRELCTALLARLTDAALADRIRPAIQGIRATVMGASQFTVQASGQTCYVSDRDLLPVRSLQVIPIDCRTTCTEETVRAELRRHDLVEWHERLAAVLTFDGPIGYRTLRTAAEAIVAVAGENDATGADPLPLFVVLKQDLAHSFGTIVKEELRWRGPVIVVDGITVGELDHLDLGTPLGASGSLPVTVTSLEFPTVSSGSNQSSRRESRNTTQTPPPADGSTASTIAHTTH
jgi:ethanolamine utilization protein EutA